MQYFEIVMFFLSNPEYIRDIYSTFFLIEDHAKFVRFLREKSHCMGNFIYHNPLIRCFLRTLMDNRLIDSDCSIPSRNALKR